MKVSMIKKTVMSSVFFMIFGMGCSSSGDQQQESLEVTQQEEAVEQTSFVEESDQEEKMEYSYDEYTAEPEVYEPDQSLADTSSSEGQQTDELVALDEEPVEYVQETLTEDPAAEPAPYELASDTTIQDEYAVDSSSEEASMEEPAAESTMASTDSKDSFVYTVVTGDSVSGVAKKVYGNFHNWRSIADASNLNNPHWIYPGNKLNVPLLNDRARDFANSYVPGHIAMNQQSVDGEMVAITVQEGDTLSNIASKHMGSESAWRSIYRQNSGNISNPNMIYPGQTIMVPSGTAAH